MKPQPAASARFRRLTLILAATSAHGMLGGVAGLRGEPSAVHPMYLKRFFVEGLAHASYLFGADGEAAVVDPKRDVDDYLAAAEREGLRIVAIFNSHPHADFASGFRELAERTGAKVYVSHLAPAKYEHVAARDGDKVKLGSLEVELLETPGHSPDSLSFLVREDDKPIAVFTGDLLFVNDVGRPDLRDADEDPGALAGKLYDSLHEKILTLPDDGESLSGARRGLALRPRHFRRAILARRAGAKVELGDADPGSRRVHQTDDRQPA